LSFIKELKKESYSITGFDAVKNIHPIDSGHYILYGVGHNDSLSTAESWILSFDDSLQEDWVFSGGNLTYKNIESLLEIADNRYLICGYTWSDIEANYNSWLSTIDSSGNLYWEEISKKPGNDFFSSLAQMKDGQYVTCGKAQPSSADAGNMWVMTFNYSESEASLKKSESEDSNGFIFPFLKIDNQNFFELSGDGILDAGERGNLNFDVLNIGRGTAHNLSVKVEHLTSERNLTIQVPNGLGDLAAKRKRPISVQVAADFEVQSMKRMIQVIVHDESEYYSDPAIFPIETREYQYPDILVDTIAIDDGHDLGTSGNANSCIEAGETIKIIAILRNLGKRVAENVNTVFYYYQDSDYIVSRDIDHSFSLGNIDAGTFKDVSCCLTIPEEYDNEIIPLGIMVDYENRNQIEEVEKQFAIPMREKLPNISELDLDDDGSQDTTEVEIAVNVDLNIEETDMDGSNTLAVVIGIEDYRNIDSPAQYAFQDANVFSTYAKKIFGIPDENLIELFNEDATYVNIACLFSEEEVGTIESHPRMQEDSGEIELLFYYAGHGLVDNSGTQYLASYDAVQQNMAVSCYSIDRMISALSRLNVHSTLIVLDACFSGRDRTGRELLVGRDAVWKAKDPHLAQNNISILSATDPSQIAGVYEDMKHGLFTYYLLNGLRGEARGDNRVLTLEELFKYIREKVTNYAYFHGNHGPQTPQLLPPDRNKVLVKY
jgi:hypothetical protein